MNRLWALDHLRWIAVLLVFVFHAGQPYGGENWHFVSSQQFLWVYWVQRLLIPPLMPLLFVVAGAAYFFQSQKQGEGAAFWKDRAGRLAPLWAWGIVLAWPQVYIERISRQQFDGSLFEFLPQYFNGWYQAPGGPDNFAWHGLHLWFVVVLLAASGLLYLFGRVTPKLRHQKWIGWSSLILLVGLLGLIAVIGRSGPGSWPIPAYLFFFLHGYWLAKANSWLHLTRTLALAILFVVTLVGFGVAYLSGWPFTTDPCVVRTLTATLGGIAWTYFLLGLGLRFLTFKPAARTTMAIQLALPFYLFHQPVIVAFAYMLDQSEWQGWTIYFVNIAATGLITLLLSMVILKVKFLRPWFGLKKSP